MAFSCEGIPLLISWLLIPKHSIFHFSCMVGVPCVGPDVSGYSLQHPLLYKSVLWKMPFPCLEPFSLFWLVCLASGLRETGVPWPVSGVWSEDVRWLMKGDLSKTYSSGFLELMLVFLQGLIQLFLESVWMIFLILWYLSDFAIIYGFNTIFFIPDTSHVTVWHRHTESHDLLNSSN